MNGLSVGSGGGYTVARGITRHLAALRPNWRVTLLLTEGQPLHEKMRLEAMPENVSLQFAPPDTTRLPQRAWYEWFRLPRWAKSHGVEGVIQLNGIVIPTLRVPTLAHFQDPWPFRPHAWTGLHDRFIAALKRQAIRRSTRRASWCGFTSQYLRDVICRQGTPCAERSAVLLNGLPRPFVERLNEPLNVWNDRPMELLTVSDVADYKRQWLVIRALPRLRKRAGFESLIYRIVGRCSDEQRAKLTALAESLGVADAVKIEGTVSDEDLSVAFRNARAFVLMSVCESFGLPAIEAMSLGTPVVTSACCAMPEVCADAAELVPVDNLDALVERLGDLLLDPARAELLRERGRKRVLRFSWMTTADHIGQVMALICARGGAKALPGVTTSTPQSKSLCQWAGAVVAMALGCL